MSGNCCQKSKDTPETYEITRGDPEYPARLEKLPKPPDQLYVKGRIPKGPMVAIVGSRNADTSVKRLVQRLSGELASHGLVVVSGGAQGIDTAAHEGALEADGVTVAVIGSGFNYMYPDTNQTLFQRVAERGALVSEFAPEQPPTKWTFPRRNRLVAALASTVLVAQAGIKSGALITARIARELNVPLGSIPGAAADPRNRGSNQLLRQGAAMVENVADLLALVERDGVSMQLGLPVVQSECSISSMKLLANLSSEEGRIVDILGSQPVHIDEIALSTGLGASEASVAILSLEIAGLVEDQGGKYFVKVE